MEAHTSCSVVWLNSRLSITSGIDSFKLLTIFRVEHVSSVGLTVIIVCDAILDDGKPTPNDKNVALDGPESELFISNDSITREGIMSNELCSFKSEYNAERDCDCRVSSCSMLRCCFGATHARLCSSTCCSRNAI